MKKLILSICASMVLATGFAQFDASQLSVGIVGNYSMYKGDFQQKTFGPQVRIGYNFAEKMTTNLSFTMGLPIKVVSQVEMVDNNGNYSTAPSEMVYKFKTFELTALRHFIGGNESAGSFYGVVGAGLVIASYKEEIKADYDKNMYTPTDLVEKDSESGFIMKLGIGGQYTLGNPILFGEAALALPANQVGYTYVINAIPTHFVFNLGVRIPLGSSGY